MNVYAWCQSTTTGHRFSVPVGERLEYLLSIGAVKEIPGRRTTTPQPHKPRRPLGVGPTPRRRRK